MTHTGFFPNPPISMHRIAKPKYHVIDVGGEPFHAVAASLIDVLKASSRTHDMLLKKILERFFLHFPDYKSPQPYFSPAERMGMLLNSARKSEVVDCMAYVLRQLAIDEIYAHPLKYRDTFDGFNRNTPQEFLRQSSTPLPISTLAALTQALGVTITLSFIEHGKELRKREVYVSEAETNSKLEMAIQVQGAHYFPTVTNKADFAYVGHLSLNPLIPVNTSHTTETLAGMIDLIESDNKRLLQSYTQWHQNLMTMVQADELSTSNLIALYIKFLPTQLRSASNLPQFFSQLLQVENKPVLTEAVRDSKQQTNELLVSSLAGWISTNRVDADELFDHIEQASISVGIA